MQVLSGTAAGDRVNKKQLILSVCLVFALDGVALAIIIVVAVAL